MKKNKLTLLMSLLIEEDQEGNNSIVSLNDEYSRKLKGGYCSNNQGCDNTGCSQDSCNNSNCSNDSGSNSSCNNTGCSNSGC